MYKLIIFNWLNLFTYCKKQRKKKLKNIFKVQKIIFLLFQFQTSSCQQQTNDECPAPDHCDLDLHSTSDLVPLLCGWLAHKARPLQRNVLMFWCCQADILISILLLLCNALWIICLVICIIYSLPQVSFQLVSMVLNHLSCMFMNFQNKWGTLSLLFEIYVYKQIMKKKPNCKVLCVFSLKICNLHCKLEFDCVLMWP